jgi:hypothetical protein
MATVPCVYCGRRPGTTDDHVPPKSLFRSPRPSNLVTVPCCLPCHRTFGKDDEYFRLAISLRWDVSSAAKEPQEAALRSLWRPQGRRFARGFLRSVREVEVRSPAGLVIGTTGRYTADFPRLECVAERIAQGLFFHHFERRLADDFQAIAYCSDHLEPAYRYTMAAQLGQTVLRGDRHEIGAEVFEYWVQAQVGDADTSVWLFRFYQATEFVVFTAPRERVAASRRRQATPVVMP